MSDILLSAVFIFLVFALTGRITAEIQFGFAEKLAAEYRWREAEQKFESAIKTDPFNARHRAGFGAFLLDQAKHRDNKEPSLVRAKVLYEEAAHLDSASAEYPLMTGCIDLRLERDVQTAFTYFQSAFRNDPNGFNTAYSIGYAGLSAWTMLDDGEKKFVLYRLMHTLKMRPYYAKYIYPMLWAKSKDFKLLVEITEENPESKRELYNFIVWNNLWQFRKIAGFEPEFHLPEGAMARKDKSLEATTYASKEEWIGYSYDGKNKISGGMMYWNGVVYMPVTLRPGKAKVFIEAKKALVIDVSDKSGRRYFPYMIARLDRTIIGEAFISSDEWQAYEFPVHTDGGARILSVEFVNDVYIPDKGEDRNLVVGSVRIYYD